MYNERKIFYTISYARNNLTYAYIFAYLIYLEKLQCSTLFFFSHF